MHEEPASFTVEEAARILSMSPQEVRVLIAGGTLARARESSVDGSSRSGEVRVTAISVALCLSKDPATSKPATEGMRRTGAPETLGQKAVEALLQLVVNLLLIVWELAGGVEVFSLRGGKPILPVPAFGAAWLSVLVFAASLASLEREFSSTNLMGTTLYGRHRTEHGDVGTKWLIVLGLPLVPIRSYVILEERDVEHNAIFRRKNYFLRALPGIHWPQALPLLALGWAGQAVFFAALWLVFPNR